MNSDPRLGGGDQTAPSSQASRPGGQATPGPSATDYVGAGAGTRAGGASRVDGYAAALYEVARAEGALEQVEDELFQVARTVETNTELREKLIDPALDASVKLELVQRLLGGRAHPQTVSAVMFVVQSGRARELAGIADAFVQLAAAARQRAVAEATTAVPLTQEQQQRLAEAIEKATGKQVSLKVVVDPKVVGGVVVRVGDTIIDGSVARRLSELRSRLATR